MTNPILAIDGGKPVCKEFLPYGQQWLDEADIQAVVDVLRGKFITQGPKIAEFENKVAHYAGAKYAVAFSSGTAALHGACFAAGIQSGDEVITTPLTFAASSNCVLYCGGTPVFADVKSDTYNIDPTDILKKVTPKTKAIIPVDFTGQPVQIDAIMQIAKQANENAANRELVVIHDAAHSLGASYKGRKIGAWADMTMFSFHPVKHVTTAEGGIIVTDNEEYYQRMLLFRSHGITKDPKQLHQTDQGDWYYEMQVLGYHYRMTDMQAALGISQMNKLDGFVTRRREIANQYNEAFRGLPGVILPTTLNEAESSWHLYILQFDPAYTRVNRNDLFAALKAENLGVNVHYIPVYLQPYYQSLGYAKGHCPNAEHIYERIITIPLFPKMSDEDVHNVIAAVKKVHAAYYM
ncbi:UDP-4-amino-4,6-dideoxy-N-acetyl-beta-L-altrosamine transaminase [Paenibacillus alginolyticus]|uniref:UDP-4-amino-4, 6-dideoxy-N-acetyl-beta-L-altrosamine transaminase n=1 Tax=Paenibacillus alginolyticus TaxID=59839 RepID=A0ABT4G870_9BACL|nr:UDP-4-amino-4,6-dideoxy-N-acetyl-beta-L-altrosamine transaminase [Paenibacillus alginolyticus]MCY9692375.1 UDP-4-amino-4,6-dideoxy-N-acetyl-beta-L-altrosamine transaminase [Paenibacillus alginolyticus]MEC0143652.1 UDP-4-amino-4,6-dideoxy-N-acetyl-beta-L-altrosamine transaminase [Paenibacillus alginolyticus]